MGTSQQNENKKPFRWFEYKPYTQNSNINNNDNRESMQSYIYSLTQNKGYLLPLSIEQCANLEKQLNLNNEGLSTKYFFKYDYTDKLLTVKKNERFFKRLKTPVISKNYTYKIKRNKRYSKNCLKLLKQNSPNYINELKIFFYNDIFKEFKIDKEDKFIYKFTNHYAMMNINLINIIKNKLVKHLKEFHKINNDIIFNFEVLKQILIKDFKAYKNKNLSIYSKFFLKNIYQENFDINIIQMIIEEGELINIINNIYNNSNNNIEVDNVLFYLLCLQYSFDNKCNIKEITTCYKAIDSNEFNSNIDINNLKESTFFMNFEYMSVTKDKNILNINSNQKEEDNDNISKNNQIIFRIFFGVPEIKNWYMAFKPLDTEYISQYPIEQEILIQPYSIFEIMQIDKLNDDNLYITVFMKTNILSELTDLKIPKEIQMNLGFVNDMGDNINEAYPNINLENIVSISFKKMDDISKNKANIGLMKNLRFLDMSNLELVDINIKEIIPYLKHLNFLNYINISLNNLSYKTLELLEELIQLEPFLEHIVLDQNSFGNEGIIALSKGLKKIDNLKSFSAFFNQIKTDGIDKLSNEIKRYKNLYYLNLSTNYIFYEEIDELVSAIKYMNNLIELNLSNNQISSEGLCFIGEILPRTIQKLNVSENEIYQDGFSEFGSYLSRIPNLTCLIIYGNRNGPSGLNSLLDGFENCPYLNHLDFGCTRIEDCDIVLILKKIRKIKNVKNLIIKENNLTDDSIFFLIQCINILTNLEQLDLSWNSLEGINLTELFGILVKFEKFRYVSIEGNPCDSNKDEIKSLLNILNQDSLININNKENKDNINRNDLKWMFEKGKFIKKNKFYSKEMFVKDYLDGEKDK